MMVRRCGGAALGARSRAGSRAESVARHNNWLQQPEGGTIILSSERRTTVFEGFIPGSRATLMLDVASIGMAVIVPLMVWSICLVRYKKKYRVHARIQLLIALVTEDLAIHYLELSRVGPVRTRARILRRTNQATLVRIELHDAGDNNRLLSIATATAIDL